MTSSISISELLAFVARDKSKSRAQQRSQALRQLYVFAGRDTIAGEEFGKELVDDYLSWAVKNGSSPRTIELYRAALRAVLLERYPEWESDIRKAFEKSPTRRSGATRGMNVEQLRMFGLTSLDNRDDFVQARDLFMFCVYCGGLDYNAAKSLTKDDLHDGYLWLPTGVRIVLNANIQNIITEYESEKSNMLFPFCRTMTEAAYVGRLKVIAEQLHVSKIKERHAEAKAWVAAARELKTDTEVMAACAYKRVEALTGYTGKVDNSQTNIDKAVNNVCCAVMDNTERWYAMKLRDRITTEHIQRTLLENDKFPHLRHLQTYYPMEDVKVKVGGKWKRDTKAFIKNVLFFRTKERYVGQIFSLVREMAWIFRQTNAPSSPYAVISQHDMENFQRAIRQFTDDVVVSIVESNDIAVGRKVRVLSGPFAGTEGVVEGEQLDATVPEMRNFYIRYVTNNAFKVQIEANESMLELIE
jgi:hypothetical protein